MRLRRSRKQRRAEITCSLVWGGGKNKNAMLAMVRFFKGTSTAMEVVARELALEFAAAACLPAMVEHIVGAANVWPDVLSRKFQADNGRACRRRQSISLAPTRLRQRGTAEPRSAWLLSQGHPPSQPLYHMPCMGSRPGNELRNSVCAEFDNNDPHRLLPSSAMSACVLSCSGVRCSVAANYQRASSNSQVRNFRASSTEAHSS